MPLRPIGRRARFFGVCAIVCLVMSFATPSDFRWVAWAATGLATFWATLLAVEDIVAGTDDGPPQPLIEAEPVFSPPPFPGRDA